MGLDIRTPIGLMFGILGILLVVYGFISDSAIYERSLGMNVNIGWGLVLTVFGGIMLALAKFAGKNPPAAAPADAPASGGRAGH